MASADWKKICCPVDVSDPSRAALAVAVDLCKRFDAQLTLLHVDELAKGDTFAAELSEWKAEAARRGLASVDTAHVAGEPQLTIADFARAYEIDLIVMGTHGRIGRDHALAGSVAESVVRRAHCPALTVHGEPRPRAQAA